MPEMKLWVVVAPTRDFRLKTVRVLGESEYPPKVKLRKNERIMERVTLHPKYLDPRLAFPSAYGLGIPGDTEN